MGPAVEATRQRLLSRAFVDPELEAEFQGAFVTAYLPITRFALGMGMLLWSVFGLLDYFAVGSGLPAVWGLRYGIGLPVLAVALLVATVDASGRWMQSLQVAAIATCGLLISAMLRVAEPPGADLYWAGLVIVLLFGHCLLPLRAAYATSIGALLVTTWLAVQLWRGVGELELFIQGFFLVASELTLIVIGYLIEQYRRRDFLQLRTLAGALNAAEASSRARSEFLAVMSHEIRTPMNGVLGMLEVLSRQVEGDTEKERFVETASRSAEALLSILDDALDFARTDAGGLKLREVPLAPAGLVEEIVALFGAGAEVQGVRIAGRVDAAVPDMLVGDEGRLRQILTNLVGNAVAFTREGTVDVEVHLAEVASSDVTLRWEVKDTGSGIAPAALEHIFEPFTQADGSSTRQHGGAGLGLAICQGLVELMGGDIGVESTPGVGSRFWFTVPMTIASEVAASSKAALPPSDTPVTRTLENHRVLVVDDNAVNRLLLRTMLTAEALVVTEVSGGEEALRVTETDDFDCILMDCQMPDIDGYEVTRRLRERGLTTPIVAVTASTGEEARRAAFDSGMNAHLGKPIRLGDLLRTLGTLRAGAPPAVVGPGGDVSEALLDEAMLAQLELLPREALRHVLELFVDAAEEHTQAMQEAMARGDLAAIGASAHALRGTAGSLGASALSRLCGDLELCCQDGRSARAAELLDMAPRDVSRAVSALRARLG